MIDHAGMQRLAAMPSLTTINGALPLTAATTKTLTSFRDLKSLDVALQDRTAPSAAPSLFALTSLEELRFTGSAVGVWLSDDSLIGLESLSRLQRLHLWGDEVTDRSMARVSKLKELESLTLSAAVSKRGLNELSGLTHLRAFAVMPAAGRTEGIDEVPLKLSTLTELRTLSLRGLALRDEDLASPGGPAPPGMAGPRRAFTEGALWHLKDLLRIEAAGHQRLRSFNGRRFRPIGRVEEARGLDAQRPNHGCGSGAATRLAFPVVAADRDR
jgi:hypothetical protein